MDAIAKSILIFGATGLIGQHITRAIVQSRDRFAQIAVFTSKETVESKSNEIKLLEAQGVKIIVGDITDASAVIQAYNGVDTVISCVGRPVIHVQLQLIDIADRHKDVKRFFPSEYGTDIEYGPQSSIELPHQQKLKVRALLQKVKNIEHTYVVTGPYGDADSILYLSCKTPEDEAEGSFNVREKRAVLLGDGTGRISLTTMRDVGALVVAALLHPDAARNRAIRVNSFTSTPNEILKEFERQTGGQEWQVAYTSLDRLRQMEAEAYAKGSSSAGPITLRRIWTEGSTLYQSRDNHLIGMEGHMESLQDAVSRAITVQRGQR